MPLVEETRRSGIDPRPLFRGLALTEQDLDVPGLTVSHLEATTVVRRALGLLGQPALGLTLGMRSQLTERGAMALGLMGSPTLGDAIALTLRFPGSAGTLIALHDELAAHKHKLFAEPLFGNADLQPFLVDLTFAGNVRLRRLVTQAQYSPLAVELVCPRPANAAEYEAFFDCPVHFGQAANVLVSDATWLAFVLPGANRMACRLSVQILEREAEQASAMSELGLSVERAIARALPHVADLAEIAASLHASERTLRRKLALVGLSYRALLDDSRKSRALELITSGRKSIVQVAAETGFSDTRAFSRAFRRWTGYSPSGVREGMLQTPNLGNDGQR